MASAGGKRGGGGAPGGASDPVKEAAALKDAANALVASKKYGKALELYTAALALDPTNAVLYSNRSGVHMDLGNFEAAAVDAGKAVELRPDWAKAHYRVGIAMERQGELELALAAFAEGVRLEPANADMTKCAARVREALASSDAAALAARKAGGFTLEECFRAATATVDVEALAGVAPLADFVRPLGGAVTLGTVPGKGRTLLATRDLPAGSEIFTERALAWYGGFCDAFGATMPVALQLAPWLTVPIDAVLLQLEPFATLLAPPAAAAAAAADAPPPMPRPLYRVELLLRTARANAIGANWNDASSDGSGACAAFTVGTALLNHDCAPNARYSVTWSAADECPVVRVSAVADIPAGSPITISYTNLTASKPKRAAALSRYGFKCTCSRCAPEWDDTMVVKCPSCGVGRVYIGAPTCSDCGADVAAAAAADGPLDRARRGYLAKPRGIKELILSDAPRDVPVHIQDSERLDIAYNQLAMLWKMPPEDGVRIYEVMLPAMAARGVQYTPALGQLHVLAGHSTALTGNAPGAVAHYRIAHKHMEALMGREDARVRHLAKLLDKPPHTRDEIETFERRRVALASWLEASGMPRKAAVRLMQPVDQVAGVLLTERAAPPTPDLARLVRELKVIGTAVLRGQWLTDLRAAAAASNAAAAGGADGSGGAAAAAAATAPPS